MRKYILIIFLVPLIMSATDCKIGAILSPDVFKEYYTNEQLEFTIQIDNINKFEAEEFDIGVRLYYDETMLEEAFSSTVTEYELPAYSENSYTLEQTFSSEIPYKYYGYVYVDYEFDIDRSNDSLRFEITFIEEETPECKPEYEFIAGDGFRVAKNLSYFPDDKTLAGYMQRGDVIGLNAEVTDNDYIRQLCICSDDTSSSFWGPYSDHVYYEWTLQGPGKIIQHDDGSGTVLYELPTCIESPYTATVTLTVKNGLDSWASDDEITGSYEINVESCPTRIYPADMVPDWDPSCLMINITKNELSNGSDGEMKSYDGSNCTPVNIEFDLAQPIEAADNVIAETGEFTMPDYAELLTVQAQDIDYFKLKCESQEGMCVAEDSIVTLFRDVLDYEWELVSGKGEFPLGNKGKSVVFHKSRSEGATVKCMISNRDAKSDDGNSLEVTYTLDSAKKPKAFVGIGDDEDTGSMGKLFWQYYYDEDIYGGKHPGFKSAAESMKTKLEEAGYEVYYNEYTTAGIVDIVVKDPLYQAMVLVGHGLGGSMILTGGGSELGFDEYTATSLISANSDAYNCIESPRLRDLQLIGCEALRGNWSSGLHCGARLHGWRTTKRVGSLRYYAYWTYTPLDPVNLSLE